MYYVTIKAKRKNAKRHIKAKFELYNMALKYAKHYLVFHQKYIIEICDGRWNTIYKAESEDKE